MFESGDWIILQDEVKFVGMHHANRDIANAIRGIPVRITTMDSDGDIRVMKDANGKEFKMGIHRNEQIHCFRKAEEPNKYGKFKIIITYIEDGKTIEEEGVTYINIEPEAVLYRYNRKRLGFMKYNGEVQLQIKDLKQITISTPDYERVFHIENGIVIREHVMYDNDRKFKGFKV